MTQTKRAAALAQQQAAAEVKYKNSFEGRAEHFREKELPPAGELKIKVARLLPARTRLVRYFSWLDRERAELARLIKTRESFFDAISVQASPKLN